MTQTTNTQPSITYATNEADHWRREADHWRRLGRIDRARRCDEWADDAETEAMHQAAMAAMDAAHPLTDQPLSPQGAIRRARTLRRVSATWPRPQRIEAERAATALERAARR